MSRAIREALAQIKPSDLDRLIIVKADGRRESFDPEKLRASLLHSGASSDDTERVISEIVPQIHNGMTTSDIYRNAFAVLNNISRPLARSYSLRRAVMDLGPSGFPFEDFVAAVLAAKGFSTKTREIVLGGCVPHEMDVIAWNEKKLIMAEVKFHNELGTKSDLKVVLYVKARFDDIRENVYSYGGKNRKLDEGWLITNTKFSSTAIHYGACKDLIMVGWNYPEKGNLQQMIEEEGLHPVTCLTTLSPAEKRVLLAGNVVLCSTINNDPAILARLLGPHFDHGPVLEEIKELYK